MLGKSRKQSYKDVLLKSYSEKLLKLPGNLMQWPENLRLTANATLPLHSALLTYILKSFTVHNTSREPLDFQLSETRYYFGTHKNSFLHRQKESPGSVL